MNRIVISFSKEEKLKLEKAAYRKALIDTETYAIPRRKVHKNKKKYDRKRDNKVMLYG